MERKKTKRDETEVSKNKSVIEENIAVKLSLDMMFDENVTDIQYKNNKVIIIDKKSNNKYVFDEIKMIDSGSYAKVFLYRVSDDCKSMVAADAKEIAVKKDTAKRSEYDIIKKMKTKKVDCNVIPLRKVMQVDCKSLDKDVKHVYVMKKIDMTLQDWLETSTLKQSIRMCDTIIASIKKQMDCLMEIDDSFVYTDLKPSNIGLMCITENEETKITKIYLIDLGSAFEQNQEYVGSLPCVENFYGNFKLENNKVKQKCINTQLFFLIVFILMKYLESINENSLCDDSYFFDSRKNRSSFFKNEVPARIRRLHKIITSLQRVLNKSRTKFDTCLSILNTLMEEKEQ